MALCATVLALWVTFTPCFLWIFLAGPFIDRLESRPRLSAALKGITAAVVGVILNLSVWFLIHVLFADVGAWGRPARSGPWHIELERRDAERSRRLFVVAPQTAIAVGIGVYCGRRIGVECALSKLSHIHLFSLRKKEVW